MCPGFALLSSPKSQNLFSNITVKSGTQCENLCCVLAQNPDIRLFVRRFCIIRGHDEPLLFNNMALLSILLLHLCRLENLEIYSISSSLDWDVLSREMRYVLWDAIHASTLTTLTLSQFINVPMKLFLGLTQLRTLELRDVDLDDKEPYSQTTPLSTGIEKYIWHVSGTRPNCS